MTGVLPSQRLRALIGSGAISSQTKFVEGQIQPASLDLRLGSVAYRVRASFLAGHGAKVADRLEEFFGLNF